MPHDPLGVPGATLDLVDARWFLELRFACGRRASFPRGLVARAHGERAWVPGVLAGTRCPACRRRPVAAAWTEGPAGATSGPGHPSGRCVPLVLSWRKAPAAAE